MSYLFIHFHLIQVMRGPACLRLQLLEWSEDADTIAVITLHVFTPHLHTTILYMMKKKKV